MPPPLAPSEDSPRVDFRAHVLFLCSSCAPRPPLQLRHVLERRHVFRFRRRVRQRALPERRRLHLLLQLHHAAQHHRWVWQDALHSSRPSHKKGGTFRSVLHNWLGETNIKTGVPRVSPAFSPARPQRAEGPGVAGVAPAGGLTTRLTPCPAPLAPSPRPGSRRVGRVPCDIKRESLCSLANQKGNPSPPLAILKGNSSHPL